MRGQRLLWLAVLGMVGCVNLTKPAPRIHYYRLDYRAEVPAGPLPYVLRVPPMEVAAAYDRDSIVYREGPWSIGSYFYHRWASNPGNMIAELLARDLADAGIYRDVQTSVSVVPPDFQVKGTVEVIEERIDGGRCSARLSLRVTLAASRGARDERVRFTRLYEADEPARCGNLASVAEAMSRGLAEISTRLQADVDEALRLNPPSP